MKPTSKAAIAVASVAVAFACAQLTPPRAWADELHNITYRARVDGVARGATISYKFDDTQVQTANPTMVPGRIFEANAVLADSQLAGMTVSIEWPYSANLHCEIEVDGNIVAQADQFIGPRLTPARDDPLYGVLACGAPLEGPGTNGNVVNTDPLVGAVPPPAQGAAPAEPAPVEAPPA